MPLLLPAAVFAAAVATALGLALIAPASAQVSGVIPNTSFDNSQPSLFALPSGYGRVQSYEDYEGERQYREALKKIPDKKPVSNDPWRTVRPAPAAARTATGAGAAYDRHKPY